MAIPFLCQNTATAYKGKPIFGTGIKCTVKIRGLGKKNKARCLLHPCFLTVPATTRNSF